MSARIQGSLTFASLNARLERRAKGRDCLTLRRSARAISQPQMLYRRARNLLSFSCLSLCEAKQLREPHWRPFSANRTPHDLNPRPHTLNPKLKPHNLKPPKKKPQTQTPKKKTQNTNHQNQKKNPKPLTLNPKPETSDLRPQTFDRRCKRRWK